MAAAVSAAGGGARVGLVDDNPDAGGQIWRASRRLSGDRVTRGWFDRLDRSAVELIPGAAVLAAPRPGGLVADVSGRLLSLQYNKLILATGARELLLPFPGWTLPNVTAVGGLQALVKAGLPIAGENASSSPAADRCCSRWRPV